MTIFFYDILIDRGIKYEEKRIIIFAIILIIATTGFFYLKPKPETTIDQEWYTIENITFDQENNKISGTSTSPYEGEIEVYLPDGIDTSKLKDGQMFKSWLDLV